MNPILSGLLEHAIDTLRSDPAKGAAILSSFISFFGSTLIKLATETLPDGPFKTYAHEHPDELLQAVKEALAVIAAHPDAAKAAAGQFGRTA